MGKGPSRSVQRLEIRFPGRVGCQVITVRREEVDDAPAVRKMNEQAFGGSAEANIVEALRSRGAVTLSLVAVHDSTVVGHILFSPVEIVCENSKRAALALGPMAVMPTFQRRGIGTRLLDHGLKLLREAGYSVLFVLGHPQYYRRFGFVPASRFGIRCQYDVPDDVFMVLELHRGAWGGEGGTVRYQPEFDEV